MDESRKSPRRPHLPSAAFVVFAVALGIRLLALLVLTPAGLVGDESYYWEEYAGAINSGQVLTAEQQIRPPLWGSILALPQRLDPEASTGRVFVAFVGALACLASFRLAREVYGEKAALAGGIVQALLPEHVLFSTYLWSEVFFGLLVAVACGVFFARPDPARERRRALAAFSILGVALLSKEFAVVPFAALLAVLIRRKSEKATLAICILLFLLPATTYSLASTLRNGRPFFVSRAAVANLGQTGLLPFRPQDDLSAQLSRWSVMMKERSAGDQATNALTQAGKLWGFHSFCTWRLLTPPDRPGAYVGGPFPFAAAAVSIAYAFALVLGLCGLAAARGELRWMSIAMLALLTSTAALAFLVSRFRIPFLFVLTIHAGVLLAAPAQALATLARSPSARILIAAMIALMAYGGFKRYGLWG